MEGIKQKAGLFTYDRLSNRVTINLGGKHEVDITTPFIKAMILFLTDGDAPAKDGTVQTNLTSGNEVKWEIRITRRYDE